MPIKQVDRENLDAIEGWLSPHAMIFTQHLIQLQRENGWISGVLELGVFKGKYLSLLAQQVAEADVPVVGVDAFLERFGVKLPDEWRDYAEKAIRDAVAKVGGSERSLTLIAGFTSEVSLDRLLDLCPARYSFISVDAGHDAEDVEHDTGMADHLLADHGVVAFDDIYNAVCPGVAEGFIRYMIHSDGLAPFATAGNKVFACRPAMHGAYYSFSKSLARNIKEAAPEMERTLEQLTANEQNNWSPRLFGWEVVPFL